MGNVELMQRFEWSVRALAQPADVQLRLYPSFVCHADELALEFDECHRAARPWFERSLTPSQMQLVEMIDRHLESMSGEANLELWTDDALRSAREWLRLRELASALVAAMGWPAGPPPFERGAIYVGSDA